MSVTQPPTVEEVRRYVTAVHEEVKVNRNFTIHLVSGVKSGIPFKTIGEVGFRRHSKSKYEDYQFFLSVDGLASSNTTIKELAMVLKIGKRLEKLYDDIQVIDIRLPTSHGFKGNKYGYRQVLDAFPHLA